MKFVIAGGTGFIGEKLAAHWLRSRHDVVILTRSGRARQGRPVKWDGKSDGPWAKEIDGADVVVNLAGRSVNCRYNAANLKDMLDSRVESTEAVGRGIATAKIPPKVWLQMSTATIYAHTFGAGHDEVKGVIGGAEPDVPAYWKISIDIAQAWEKALAEAKTPATRKVVLRTAMVMGRAPDSVFGILRKMSGLGLGGAIAGGGMYMSWIHEEDFARVMDFLVAREDLAGVFNICAPNPIPQREFMATLRQVIGMPIGLPATAWMVRIGAVFMRTDAELLLKSRRVVPGRLLESGYQFRFPEWRDACADLAR